MAKLSSTGLDDLNEAFAKAGEIPKSTTTSMLKAMGAEVLKLIRNSAGTHSVPFGPMLSSLYNKTPKVTNDGGSIVSAFRGGRTRGNTYTREVEIAFITNYGKRGEPPRSFITTVTENPSDSIAAAGEKELSAYLDSVGL